MNLSSLKTAFVRSNINILLILSVAILAIFLRLFPGTDHYIWSYDQARDAFISESIFAQRNIVLRGPQTEFPGLTHGPIIYWFTSPFYFLSQGDPNLPAVAMILANVSTMIPIGILTWMLTKKKFAVLISCVLFAVAYEQIEYARWISNVSLANPFLAWFFLFLYQTTTSTKKIVPLLCGIFLGLAVQAEFFLVFWFLWITIYWGITRKPILGYVVGILGTLLGTAPMVLAEIKFEFLGIRTFFTQFLLSHHPSHLDLLSSLQGYARHLQLTTHNTLTGVYLPGIVFFCCLVGGLLFCRQRKLLSRKTTFFLLSILFAHSILFLFKYIDAIFLDLGVGIALILTCATLLSLLYYRFSRILAVLLVSLILFSQIQLLIIRTHAQRPFDLYQFIQSGILFSQKLEVIETSLKLGQTKDLSQVSFAALGTPYSVRTVWASLWRVYAQRNNQQTPVWFGEAAHGFPGEQLLPKTDHPQTIHILIIEPNLALLPQPIVNQFLSQQNEATEVVKQTEKYGFIIQVRRPKIDK